LHTIIAFSTVKRLQKLSNISMTPECFRHAVKIWAREMFFILGFTKLPRVENDELINGS